MPMIYFKINNGICIIVVVHVIFYCYYGSSFLTESIKKLANIREVRSYADDILQD